MALVAANTVVGITGSVSYAPVGTTAPTSATAALPAAWLDLGYLNEDGITENIEQTAEDLRAWQNNAVVRTVVTEAAARYNFVAIETKKAVIELYYAGTITTDQIVVDPAATGGRKSFVIDVIDGAKTQRIYIAEGEVTERGERTITSTDLVGYPMTITAYTKPIIFFSPTLPTGLDGGDEPGERTDDAERMVDRPAVEQPAEPEPVAA